jgi:ATP-dependent RNA helicase SUPV3L1/SUV3
MINPIHFHDKLLHEYPKARAINRHHYFYVGPTNSGKTHHAFLALEKASSGVYLAPLRLLAMEIRDRLVTAGVPCNLITGEERAYMDGATHTASTIEMLNPNQSVDVAIIDEIQMLQDPERGAAWTNALIGVPAKSVFICGSNAVTSICLRVIDALNETHSITHTERLTPLMLEEQSICGERYQHDALKKQLQAGDAIIAFSRKDVLTLSARIRQWGFSVASIYGALSPEVRRAESARFCEGKAEILVATDAIGMGLNLPIRRVIFSSIYKFDGIAMRTLNATEVRQIAGRAGRFGIYPTGFVAVLEDDERPHIAHMLATDDTAHLTGLPQTLHYQTLQSVGETIHTKKLSEILMWIDERRNETSNLFTSAPLNRMIAQAKTIDDIAHHMALADKFIFACAPISLNMAIEKDYFLLCLKSVFANIPRSLPAAPSWLLGQHAKYLEAAELLSQNLSLYAWLSYKFPKIFISSLADIQALKTAVSGYIKQALLVQTGYLITSKEIELQSVNAKPRLKKRY